MSIKMRNMVADYLNVSAEKSSENYALMGAGFTKLDEKPNAKSKGKKYICDSSETKTIVGHEVSFPFESDLIKEEEAVKYIVDIAKNLKIGSDAETDYIKVDLDERASESETSYKARKFKVAIEVDEISDDEGQMGVKGTLLGKGNPVQGTFDIQTRKFTPEVKK